MSLLLGDMLVRYKADITDLTVKSGLVKEEMLGTGEAAHSAGGLIAGGLIAGTAAVVGIGVASVKAASDFQTAMISNVAHAGLAKSEFDNVSKSVLAMSTAVGRSPTQLAEALYPILSAFSGIQNQSAKSAIALDTLRMSFQTVAGTTVDGTAVANAAVGTFNSLGLATNNVSTNTQRMTDLFDVMDKTVQLGNMQWDAYKNVVSKLAVAIQGTGISFKESQAALATMTNEGFSAQRASTYLSNTFTTLAIKTDVLAKHAKTLKISFDENKYASMDFADKIEYLNQVTDGNKQKLLALMGNNSTALKTFNALSIGIDSYRGNLDALNHAQGTLAGSFAEASKGFNFQMEQMKAAGDALLVTIGTQLLPIASRLLAAFTPLITGFTTLVAQGAPATSLFSQLANGWKEFANGLDTGEITAAFTSFTQTVSSTFANIKQVAGPFLTNFNSLLISLAGYLTGLVAPALKIASQYFAGWGQEIQTIMLALETNLFPAIRNLVGVIAPVIIAIAQWVADSGFLPIAFNAISFAVGVVIGSASLLINVLSGVIGFFTQTEVGVALLKGALVAVGAVMLFNAVTAIPSMVVGLIGLISGYAAWAVAAWSVAVANIVAFWPVYLIIAAIVVIVALVILAVQHWGEIAHWLQGVWGAIANFFVGLWNGIKSAWGGAGKWFQDLFAGAWHGITSTFGNIGQWFADKFNGLKNTVGNTLTGVKTTAQTGMGNVGQSFTDANKKILDSFHWLYDHNYYVKAIVDNIRTTFTVGIKFWEDQWNRFTGWLAGIWATIKKDATDGWAAISSFFTGIWQNYIAGPLGALWNFIVGWLTGLTNDEIRGFTFLWQKVSSIFMGVWQNYIAGPLGALWNSIASWWNSTATSTQKSATDTWSKVSSVFSSAWNTYVSKPLSSLWTSISSWFNNLGKMALQSGQNFISMLVQGIQSGAGAIWNAVKGIAGNIWSALGFHSPTESGPGKDADKWMPNLIKMMVAGLNAGVPQIKTASQNVAAPLQQQLAYPIKPSAVAVAAASQQASSSSNQGQTFILEVDGHQLAQIVNTSTDRTVRLKLGARGRAA